MKETLKQYIERDLVGDDALDLADGDDLLLSGLLDSVAVMSLVTFVEDTFDVRVPPEDVTIEHFRSVDTIGTYLSERGVGA